MFVFPFLLPTVTITHMIITQFINADTAVRGKLIVSIHIRTEVEAFLIV